MVESVKEPEVYPKRQWVHAIGDVAILGMDIQTGNIFSTIWLSSIF